jgi:hypothetical protein
MANEKKQIAKAAGASPKVIAACCVAAVFVAGIFVAYNLGQKENGDITAETTATNAENISREIVTVTEPVGGRGMVVNEENASSVKEWAETPIEDAYYELRMNFTWDFPDGESVSPNAYVENSENNKRTVYFDVVIKDTQELIYSSPFIPVTGKLDEIKLNRDLEKGEYPATLTYHLVDDNFEEITTVSVRVTLNVES